VGEGMKGSPGVLLTVVIPTYDRLDLLRRCLDRLRTQTFPGDAFEIVVVDDASRDPIAPRLERDYRGSLPEIRWLRVEENSPARARNLGISEARGELILFIGDDIFARPNMIEEHVRAHADAASNVAVLCRIEADPEQPKTAFERFFDPFGFTRLRGDQELDYRFFWTNNISLKASFLRQHGGFDERFPDANHEDVELGYRLSKAGMRIRYRDRLVAYHFHPYTLESACRLLYRRGSSYHLLRQVVPDEAFREQLGIFSWGNSPRAVVRGLVRSALFNDLTAPIWVRWLGRDRENPMRRFFYWKLLTYYTNKGFREASR
jgi:GT2 family glycosyltransferase